MIGLVTCFSEHLFRAISDQTILGIQPNEKSIHKMGTYITHKTLYIVRCRYIYIYIYIYILH